MDTRGTNAQAASPQVNDHFQALVSPPTAELGYFFDVGRPESFVAAGGARALLGDPVTGALSGEQVVAHMERSDSYGRLATAVDQLVSKHDPVGSVLGDEEERLLCAYCYLLALYEAPFRSLRAVEASPLRQLPPGAPVEAQLALVDDGWVDDLVALSRAVRATTAYALCGRPTVAGPTFAGSRDVGGADADLIVDGLLIEVKTTTAARPERPWVYQLLGYALLDYDDSYGIDRVGFYLPRAPALVSWQLDGLLATLAGRPVLRSELRAEFRDAALKSGVMQASLARLRRWYDSERSAARSPAPVAAPDTAMLRPGHGAPAHATLSRSLVPLPDVVAAEAYQLEAVCYAVLRDEVGLARRLLDRIDHDALWGYYDTAGDEWSRCHRKEAHAAGPAPPGRSIPKPTKLEVATRDGWRCRYCGVRLISFDFSRKLNELFPDVWVIDPAVERRMHPAAYLLRYTQDHVVPYSAGGDNSADNLVACCGTCQYQKGSCTLQELGLADPRSYPPANDRWDGLSGRFGPTQCKRPPPIGWANPWYVAGVTA